MKDKAEEKGKLPCGVCKNEVGNNSVLCHGCKKLIHKRRIGVKGSLRNASQLFICRCCKADSPITDGLSTGLHLDIGNGISLEKVDKLCYLGDMLDVDGGCDSAVTTRIRSAWIKFREYLPILTGKGFLLKLKGKVYATCVRSCLMHGSDTWPMKVEHELTMNRTGMIMIRWMCGFKLNVRKKSENSEQPVSLMTKIVG